jgi:hypothetical protein
MKASKVSTEETRKALAALRKALVPAVQEALDTLAEIGASNARSTKLYKNRSGKLRQNTKFRPAGTFIRDVIADTSYAGYVNFGNRPGGTGAYIYPKRKKALRFVIDGKVIFARRVRSHGPLPFMDQARDLMVKFIPDLFESKIARAIQGVTK